MNTITLQQIDELLQKRLAHVKKNIQNDLEKNLIQIKKDLGEKIDDAVSEIIEVVDKHKADKTDVENLKKRVAIIEDKLHSY